MRHSRSWQCMTAILPCAALILILTTGCTHAGTGKKGGSEYDSTVAAIEKTLNAIVDAAVRGDVETVDRYFADDVTFIDARGITRGRAEFRENRLAAHSHSLTQRDDPSIFRLGSIQVNLLSADAAVAVYPYRAVIYSEAGKPGVMFGFATAVLENRGGTWQVVHYHTAGRRIRPGERFEDFAR